MKKLIALFLILTMALSMAACGSAQEEPEVEDVPAVEDTPVVDEPAVEEDPTMDQPAAMPEETPVTDDMPAVMPEDEPVEDEPVVEEPPVETPAVDAGDNAALEVLNAIWALYGDEEKFPVMGGNPEGGVMDMPGAFDLAYAESLAFYLQLPQEQLANVDQAATMIHMMNTNTFTGGALHLTEGTDAAAFAAAARDSIQSAQWMCGFPEQLIIAAIDGQILIAFGVADAMGPFAAHLSEAFPAAEILYNEAING